MEPLEEAFFHQDPNLINVFEGHYLKYHFDPFKTHRKDNHCFQLLSKLSLEETEQEHVLHLVLEYTGLKKLSYKANCLLRKRVCNRLAALKKIQDKQLVGELVKGSPEVEVNREIVKENPIYQNSEEENDPHDRQQPNPIASIYKQGTFCLSKTSTNKFMEISSAVKIHTPSSHKLSSAQSHGQTKSEQKIIKVESRLDPTTDDQEQGSSNRKQDPLLPVQSIIASQALISTLEVIKCATPVIPTQVKTNLLPDEFDEIISQDIEHIKVDQEVSTNVPQLLHQDIGSLPLQLKLIPTQGIETEAVNQALPVLKSTLKPISVSKRQIRTGLTLTFNKNSPKKLMKPKRIKKIFQLLSKWSHLRAGYQEVIRSKHSNKGIMTTRSNRRVDTREITKAIKKSKAVQYTYGHYGLSAQTKIFDHLREPAKYFPETPLTDDYSMTEESTFLDIGSGFAIPSISLHYILGCETYGVEANEARFKSSKEFIRLLVNDKLAIGVDLQSKVHLEYGNACSTKAAFTTNDNKHISHIFAYNYAQVNCKKYMPGVVARLNNTNFKLLAWSANPYYTLKKFKLKADYLGNIRAATSGGENHTVFFYAKKPKHTTRVMTKPVHVAIEKLIEEVKQTAEDSDIEETANEGTNASIFQFAPSSTSTEYDSSAQVVSMLGKRKESESSCNSSDNPQKPESPPKKRDAKQTTTSLILQRHSEAMEILNNVYNDIVQEKHDKMQSKPTFINGGATDSAKKDVERHLKITLGRLIGQGAQAVVYEAVDIYGSHVAVKMYNSKLCKEIQQENDVIDRLQGNDPGSAHCFFIINRIKTDIFFASRYLLMDQYDISMHDLVFSGRVAKAVIRQQLYMIFRAIASCHLKNVVHRDIKLCNVLIGKDHIPRLIDFGMSWMTNQPPPTFNCGTTSYMAPELFKGQLINTFEGLKRVDSWALGVLVYIAMFKKRPFKTFREGESIWINVNDQQQVDDMMQLEKRLSQNVSQSVRGVDGLIRQLLRLNPSERITPAVAMEHEWFKPLLYNQLRRPNMSDVMIQIVRQIILPKSQHGIFRSKNPEPKNYCYSR